MVMKVNTYNTVWITGTPRTGSMWTTNVVREILKSADFKPLPELQFQAEEEWLRLYTEKSLRDQNQENKYVLKTHQILNPGLPRSRYITNVRNPYDVCASFYQFMKCDVERAIAVALSLKHTIAHYKSFEADSLHIVAYDEIETNPTSAILKLARFLNCNLDDKSVEHIERRFCKERTVSIISENEQRLNYKIQNKKPISKIEIVQLSPTNYRSFDPETGFQSGHVSNRKSGQWRQVFSTDQISKIILALDSAAVELGYKSELI